MAGRPLPVSAAVLRLPSESIGCVQVERLRLLENGGACSAEGASIRCFCGVWSLVRDVTSKASKDGAGAVRRMGDGESGGRGAAAGGVCGRGGGGSAAPRSGAVPLGVRPLSALVTLGKAEVMGRMCAGTSDGFLRRPGRSYQGFA